MEIHGIPVDFDPLFLGVAYTEGLWPLTSIIVGAEWGALDARERQGVLLHEAHHCLAWHMALRILWAPFCWTKIVQRWTREQELSCDAFAVREGYGLELLLFVNRRAGERSVFYPSRDERVANILAVMQGMDHGRS